MNPAHLHLMVTHLPVLGSVFGLLILLLALLKGDPDLKRISFWVFVLAGLAAIPTYLTGRPASKVLMKLMPGMSMDSGDQHAEVAVLALTAALILAAVALIGLLAYRRPKRTPGWFTFLTLVLALVTTAAMTWTAGLGGSIRHTEIQTNSGINAAH